MRPATGARQRTTARAIASLLLISVLLSLLALELLSRAFFQDPRGLFQRSPTLGYEMVPNYSGRHKKLTDFDTRIATNGLGFRDHDLQAVKSLRRILVLGDSVTFGWGMNLEDTYPKLIEALWPTSAGSRPFEVINAGVWGYNTLQEIEFLQRDGAVYQPDLVLVGFTSPETVKRNWYCRQRGVVTVEPHVLPQNGAVPAVRQFLKDHSNLYSFLERRWHFRHRLLPSWQDIKRLLGEQPVSQNASAAGQPASPSWPESFPGEIPIPAAVQASRELLGALRAKSMALGAEFAVVIFPTDYQVLEVATGHTPPSRDRTATRALVEALAADGVTLFDLTDPLSSHALTEKLFLPDDNVHPSLSGQRRSAQAIYPFLEERVPGVFQPLMQGSRGETSKEP